MSAPVTQLLKAWTAGEQGALEKLTPLVYEHLQRLAASALRSERVDHTLAPPALVNEAYLRLLDSKVEWKDRLHFFSLAARLMRRILVDYARASRREKRGGGVVRVTLSKAAGVPDADPDADVEDVDEALESLARTDERKAKVIELIFFGGLTQVEAAEALGVSESTLLRDLKVARAWLYKEISRRRN
ncbi:MAG: sigma-70 family RNA polymerase sigma factor [Acidobacteria bacterium]|nr:sigma-70 family RNA polymerase sigma factor [Acidobacteriota bacterium]